MNKLGKIGLPSCVLCSVVLSLSMACGNPAEKANLKVGQKMVIAPMTADELAASVSSSVPNVLLIVTIDGKVISSKDDVTLEMYGDASFQNLLYRYSAVELENMLTTTKCDQFTVSGLADLPKGSALFCKASLNVRSVAVFVAKRKGKSDLILTSAIDMRMDEVYNIIYMTLAFK
jgi:hypothetical protein